MTEEVLRVDQLCLRVPTVHGLKPIVDQVGFSLGAGQGLGIVGESGSGKTMLARTLMGLLPQGSQVSGAIRFQGHDLRDPEVMQRVRGRGLAMVFQEPGAALNPVYSAAFHLMETLRCHQPLTSTQARQKARDLLAEVQFPDPDAILGRYPHQLSGGQQQRLLIALALAGDPQILIADEPTTALDVTIQAQILLLIRQLQQQRHMGLIFITHDLALLNGLVEQVVVMSQGRVVEQGSLVDVFSHPQQPYTQGLLACRPPLDRTVVRLPTLGDPVTPEVVAEDALAARRTQLQQQPPLLQVNDLKTYFPISMGWWRVGEVRAVDGVSFELYPGETLGVVGESGSGKSTLGRTLLRLTAATAGEVIFGGEPLLTMPPSHWRTRRRQIQTIFQDPYNALNPRLSVGEAILEPLIIHRLRPTPAARRQRVLELLHQVGLAADVWDRFPNQFSGGQRQRIGIARALAAEPRLLICDECVSALDVSVQAQILNLLKDLRQQLGLTYLFISHDLSVVRFISDRVLVMQQGRMVELAPTETLYRDPQQEYTRRLWAAVPQLRLT
ncbi:MAG: ABC transporter ATP-binding protein [Synechococcales cyanobacterium]